MAIDPMIANPATVKLDDPLEKFNNYLLASTRMSGLRKEKREEAIRNALVEGIRLNTDDKGNTNWAGVRSYAAQNKIGDAIPGILEDEGKRAKMTAERGEIEAKTGLTTAQTVHEGAKQKKTEAEKANTDTQTFEKAMGNYRQELAAVSHDPKVGIPQLVQWKMRQFADPVIGPMLRERGETPESAVAALKETLKSMPYAEFLKFAQLGAEKATKKNVTTLDLGGHKQVISTNEHAIGAPKQEVLSDQAVTLDVNSAAKAPKVNVTTPVYIAAKGDTSYTETWNKGLAESDLKLMAAADGAPDLIKRADRVGAVLKGGKVITGVGAPLFLAGEKLLGPFGDKEKIANTETLGSDLAKMTLDNIRSSGLGGGNGFTDKDREFLEKAVSGQITWDNASLQRMAQLARQQGEQMTRRWASRKSEIQGTGIQGRAYPQTTPTVPPAPPKARSNDKGFQQNLKRLKAGEITPSAFDKVYGAGAAASVGVK